MEKQYRKALLGALLLGVVMSVPAAAEKQSGWLETPRGGENWVGTWATAPHQPDLGVPGLSNSGFTNQTLRQIVHTSVEGSRVRVRLSAFGSNGLVVNAAHLALRTSGAEISPVSDRTLTFGGSPSVTIPAGALVLSDPVNLEVAAFSDVAISIFTLGNSGPATWHFEARALSFISLPGDFTASASMPVAASAPAWFWLAGLIAVQRS